MADFKTSVELVLTSNVLQEMEQITKAMTEFSELVGATVGRLEGLAEALENVGRLSGSVRNIATAFVDVREAMAGSAPVAMAEAVEQAESATAGLLRESRELSVTLRENAELAGRMATGMNSANRGAAGAAAGAGRASRNSHGSLLNAGISATIMGGFLEEGIKKMMEPALEEGHYAALLGQQGLSAQQVDAARQKAFDTSMSVPGSTTPENLKEIGVLRAVFGSLEEAEKLLPAFAQSTQFFRDMDTKNGGNGDPGYAAAKALEILGLTGKEERQSDGSLRRVLDPETAVLNLQRMQQSVAGMNGTVKAEDFLAMAKQAGNAGMQLTPEFLFQKLPAIMQAFGGAKSGTAIQSLSQIFEGGKLTPKSAKALSEIGLGGGSEVDSVDKRGRKTKTFKAGPVFEADVLNSDPSQWADDVRKKLIAQGHVTMEDQLKTIAPALQRSTVARFLSEFIANYAQVQKDQENINKTNPNVGKDLTTVDPAAKVQQFESALKNLMNTFGSAMMPDAMRILDLVTAGLNNLAKWAHDNPDMASTIGLTVTAFGALTLAVGALATAAALFAPEGLAIAGLGAAATALTVLAARSSISFGNATDLTGRQPAMDDAVNAYNREHHVATGSGFGKMGDLIYGLIHGTDQSATKNLYNNPAPPPAATAKPPEQHGELILKDGTHLASYVIRQTAEMASRAPNRGALSDPGIGSYHPLDSSIG